VADLDICVLQVTLFTRTGVGSEARQGRYAVITKDTAYVDDPSDPHYEIFQEQQHPSGVSTHSVC
jgi:hypothetical protein